MTYAGAQREPSSRPRRAVLAGCADTVLKASLGRAVRMPTVAELYGATSTTNSQFINDPNLRPERSWTGELSAEKDFGPCGCARRRFSPRTRATRCIRRRTFDPVANRNVSRVQNVGRIATTGLEVALTASDWLVQRAGPERQPHLRRLDDQGQRRLRRDAGRHDRQVAAEHPALARDGAGELPGRPRSWSASLAARYSGRQYRTLNNARRQRLHVHGREQVRRGRRAAALAASTRSGAPPSASTT